MTSSDLMILDDMDFQRFVSCMKLHMLKDERMGFFSILPRTLILHIFSFLSGKDFIAAKHVCSYWNTLIIDDQFWFQVLYDRRHQVPEQLQIITAVLEDSAKDMGCNNEKQCTKRFIENGFWKTCLVNFNKIWENRDFFYSLRPTSLFKDAQLIKWILFHIKNAKTTASLATLFLSIKILSREDENLEFLANEGGDDLVLQAMKNHPGDALLQREACGALWNLAFEDKCRQNIIKKGGTELLLDSMKQFCDDIRVQAKACGALANVTDDENHQMIVDQGGVELIISLMDKFSDDLEIQQNASCVLINLSINDDKDKLKISHKIVKNYGIEFILQVMRKHISDTEFIRNACEILKILSNPEGVTAWTSLARENQHKIMLAGGVELLELAKKKYASEADVQLSTNTILSYVSDFTKYHLKATATA